MKFAYDLVIEVGMAITEVSTNLLAYIFIECTRTSISLFSEGCIQGSSQM